MTEDQMVGLHYQLNGHEFKQTLGDGEGQGSLACCSPWDCKELNMTERQNKSQCILNTQNTPITRQSSSVQLLSHYQIINLESRLRGLSFSCLIQPCFLPLLALYYAFTGFINIHMFSYFLYNFFFFKHSLSLRETQHSPWESQSPTYK